MISRLGREFSKEWKINIFLYPGEIIFHLMRRSKEAHCGSMQRLRSSHQEEKDEARCQGY